MKVHINSTAGTRQKATKIIDNGVSHVMEPSLSTKQADNGESSDVAFKNAWNAQL